MTFNSLTDWLTWQEQLHPSEIELGLDRVKTVAARLPFFSASPKIKTVIVGGTNGKGSCVAILEQIFIAAGYRVGAYSSPHLLQYNERVRLNGSMVRDAALCAAFERVDAARRDESGNETSLTYFEFGTLAALDIFQRAKVEIQILEVGLGGRLDAVNIMEPDIAVVTNVALDHEAWLGNTREKIGFEKAGIFRAGIPLVIGEPSPPNSLWRTAAQLRNTRLRVAGGDFGLTEHGTTMDFTGTDRDGEAVEWQGLPLPSLPLPSAACALQVVIETGWADRAAVEKGLKRANLPGRFQRYVCTKGAHAGRELLLDVAHNPAGAAYLAQRIQQIWGKNVRLPIVFSALADKDHAGLVSALAAIASAWYVAPLTVPRATPAATLSTAIKRMAPAQAIQQFDTLGAALDTALAESTDGLPVLVCGSFYTVAEALHSF
jgi:dihydrofolate synthase/folylpolyglutamate synthase